MTTTVELGVCAKCGAICDAYVQAIRAGNEPEHIDRIASDGRLCRGGRVYIVNATLEAP